MKIQTGSVLGLALLASLVIMVTPANAQHPGNHGQRGGQQHGQRGERGERGNHNEGRERQRAEERHHYDGRHFDRDYRGRYLGHEHLFVPEVLIVGGCWQFWYGGFYYNFYEPYPYIGEEIFIDQDGDFYYMYAPAHPGWRVQVAVVL
jgi:hypothetical protein